MLFHKQFIPTLFLLLLAAGCSSATTTGTDLPTNSSMSQIPSSGLSTQTTTVAPSGSEIRIPSQTDWVDCGIILKAGEQGDWDYYLWGGFAFSVIKKGETYYLYYQGASDYRTKYDETVMWRAIGLATSTDGIHFSKYAANPILSWFPNNNGEEGAVSSGVTLGVDGEIVLFYGANTEESATTVNADTRVASSLNGMDFLDLGIVLDHNNRSVWGSGDELFVVDAIYDQGVWIVYYIPNGTPERGLLGVSYGSQDDALEHSSAVTDGANPIPVWGTMGHAQLGPNTYALILNNNRDKRIEVRLVSLQTPALVSEPVAVYQFDEVHQANFLLDEEKETWFMYYRTFENSYGVKLASTTQMAVKPSCTS